jgi:hypothetical protein
VGLLLSLAPAASAQNTGSAPYDGCSRHPETCDPVAANEGQVRTGDQAVRVILFGHFQDMLQRAPVNTQPPHPELEPDVNAGFLMPTLYVENEGAPCCRFQNNRFLMVSSPGLIEHDGVDQWRVRQQPYLPYPLRLAGDTVTGFWYISPGSGSDAAAGEPRPGVMPGVGVYMRMETGYLADRGTLIAQGDTGSGYRTEGVPETEGTITMLGTPGQDVVYEFQVPMRLEVERLPFVTDGGWATGEGFVVTAVPYQIEYSDAVSVTQSDWRLRTGPEYPPRLVVDVERPMRTVMTETVPHDQGLAFRWHLQSVFGSYDVDLDSFTMRVTGPDGVVHADGNMTRDIRYSTDHAGVFRPVNATWRLMPGIGDGPLPDGRYHVDASVVSHQGTYRLTWEQDYRLRDGAVLSPNTALFEGEAAPGAGGLFALVGLAVALGLVSFGIRTKRF